MVRSRARRRLLPKTQDQDRELLLDHCNSTSGQSMDAEKVASLTGAYTNESPHYLQTTGFLLAPDGKILKATYSSDQIGGLVAEDVIGMVN